MRKLHDSHFIITFTLGNRRYELVPFHQPDEEGITTKELVQRAKLLNADLHKSDVRWVVSHQTELNPIFRDRFDLVIVTPTGIVIVSWDDREGRWFRDEQMEEHIGDCDREENEDLRYQWDVDQNGVDYGWRLVRRVQ